MGIESVGSLNKIFQEYDTKKWVKSADMEGIHSFELKEAPKINIGKDSTQSFSQLLASSMNDVNKLQTDANTAIQKLVTGKTKNLHETMLTVEKADIAFRTMNQVRMKVIDAYKEVMRMQI